MIDLLIPVINYSGIKFSMYIVEDNKYGGIGSDNKWDGMIGDLVNGKADLAVAALTPTEGRARVVDFTVPFFDGEIGIVVKPQIAESNSINFEYLAPLSGQLQLMILLLILGAAVSLYVFENSIYLTSFKNLKHMREKYYSAIESVTYIGGVTLQRDIGGKNPERPGARLPAVLFAFGMVIFVTTYTAILAVNSIEFAEKNPFKGSKDQRVIFFFFFASTIRWPGSTIFQVGGELYE